MPDPAMGLEVYANTDFTGNWNKVEAMNDHDIA